MVQTGLTGPAGIAIYWASKIENFTSIMPEIRIVCLGTKMPQWVNTATDTYTSRIPRTQFEVNVIEVPLIKRTRSSNIQSILEKESRKVLTSIPRDFLHISLERTGKKLSSRMLCGHMCKWRDDGQPVAISIGGPEGFPVSHTEQCDQLWSLSDLTLAHPVARVVLAEQLFRGWSILTGHPYHRSSCI